MAACLLDKRKVSKSVGARINHRCFKAEGVASKAELPLEGTLFGTQFPSLGIFIKKKLEIKKTKTN